MLYEVITESDTVFRTMAGPEIGVASTKAFTTQLTILAAFAIAFVITSYSIHYTKLYEYN